jgi:hypothetical protein
MRPSVRNLILTGRSQGVHSFAPTMMNQGMCCLTQPQMSRSERIRKLRKTRPSELCYEARETMQGGCNQVPTETSRTSPIQIKPNLSPFELKTSQTRMHQDASSRKLTMHIPSERSFVATKKRLDGRSQVLTLTNQDAPFQIVKTRTLAWQQSEVTPMSRDVRNRARTETHQDVRTIAMTVMSPGARSLAQTLMRQGA